MIHSGQAKHIFEFKDRSGGVQAYRFGEETDTIAAHTLEEVLPALRRLQDYTDRGCYACGYVSYEAAPAFDASYRVQPDSRMPLLWFGIFDKPLEHIEEESGSGQFAFTDWTPTVTYPEFEDRLQEIKNAILVGDTYQINYTIRLRSRFEGDSTALFRSLAKKQRSSYNAYLRCGGYTVVSVSPELFFHKDHDRIVTKPMKGTTPRGRWLEESRGYEEFLYSSEKNKAENLMIVDLLRNDLSRISVPGTVKVERLFEIEHYPTVLQMTSTIAATLQENILLEDVFSALFPCGSITGAPKISTMTYIANLESSPREAYCGTVGIIKPDGEAIFNVAIRTVMINNSTGQAEYGIGGGITWDSDTSDEYQEVLAKAAVLSGEPYEEFRLSDSLLLENGQFFLLERHLHSLLSSCVYFGFETDMECVRSKLLEYADGLGKRQDKQRVNIIVSGSGGIELHHENILVKEDSPVFGIARAAVDEKNILLYHKTTNRSEYEKCRRSGPYGVDDLLLWNRNREITGFTTGNAVVKIGGCYYTPQRGCGVVAGAMREELLGKGVIREEIVRLDDRSLFEELWLINSINGITKINMSELVE
jgi:para-aminobenzoate synthetase / 4-amino-4-deoxychorismate lyase